MKYIIDDHNTFLIFSKVIKHSDVKPQGLGMVVGAGFCTIRLGYVPDKCTDDCGSEKTVVNVHCYGESTSLGIKSREEDEVIINQKINNPY